MKKRFEESAWRDSMQLRIDYTNMMEETIGEHGVPEEALLSRMAEFGAASARMEEKRAAMEWRALPFTQKEVVSHILETAAWVRKSCDAFVVFGIGGSALGPFAVQQALSHMRHNELPSAKRNGPKLYVEDNIDPERMASLMDVIEPERTIFNVITKSGSTSETMAQFLWLKDFLQSALGEGWRDHVIATTDANHGSLIKIANEEKIRTFYVPEGVGGRFSELSPVGLLPAAVCGIDIEELLAGAAYMDALCCEQDIFKNPAYLLAALDVVAMERGCNISVLMPYADSLRFTADWFAQLWAESLGKRYALDGQEVRTGQTPVKALGVTDQHSQMQLYLEGPYDKVVTFLGVAHYRSTVKIPRLYQSIPDIAFLGGHTFNALIHAEQAATEYALRMSGHMCRTITLPEVNPFTIGELLYLFEMQTAFAGELLGINAFDQPGVEIGKESTYALLGKPGFESKREQLNQASDQASRFRI